MNILQINLGELDKKRSDCIESSINKLEKEDNYFFISDSKLKKRKVKNIEYKEYINNLDTDLKHFINRIPYNYKNFWLISDLIRLDYLSKNENVLYLDTDVKLKNKIDFDNEIYMAEHKKGFDYCIIYNGDKLEFFKKIIKDHVLPLAYTNIIPPRPWLYVKINKYESIKKIGFECFDHFHFRNK